MVPIVFKKWEGSNNWGFPKGDIMGSEDGYDDKIDVIDFIINVLKEHEKKLDELVSRLEGSNVVETLFQKPISGKPVEKPPQVQPTVSGKAILAVVKKWSHFVERCTGAGLVAFDLDGGVFKVSAVVDGMLYAYKEEVPDMEIRYKIVDERAHIESIDISKASLVSKALKGKLNCGLEFAKREVEKEQPEGETIHKVVYEIDPLVARSWLAYQLGTKEENIVQGKLQA